MIVLIFVTNALHSWLYKKLQSGETITNEDKEGKHESRCSESRYKNC